MAMTKQKDFEKAILAHLRQQGNRSTRPSLISALNVTDPDLRETYRAAEQALVDKDKIEVRRGRNGGVFLITETELEPTPEALGKTVAEERRKEKHHYANLKSVLEGEWALDGRFQSVNVCETAYLGRKRTGGRWTRPDLTALCVSQRIFDPHKRGDVRTFEVKLFETVDVSAVFEAVSHRARSHYSYLLIVGAPNKHSGEERLEPVVAEAARHGVGVYVIEEGRSGSYSGWELHLDARISDADPIEIENFVEQQVAAETRKAFMLTLRK